MQSDNVPEGGVPPVDEPDDTSGACIGILVKQATAALSGYSDSARLDAELLLAHVLQRTRAELGAHPEQAVSTSAHQHYTRLIAQRAAGMPLAYLTGEREFWSLPLFVSREVLIPRPETELVVERCLRLLGASAARVAELGTGSGAIALALAIERPGWHLTATDRSAAALNIARANAARLGARNVELLEGVWFEPLGARRFDLIASNPPYVAEGDAALEALRHEPSVALTPGPTGLEALLHIIELAPAFLLRPGWLVLEHGIDQAAALARALVAAGAAGVVCHRDLSGRERVTEAQWL